MEWRKWSHLNASTAARAKKERLVPGGDSGPRLEARKKEKGKRKVAKVTPEFAGAAGKQDTLQKMHQGELEKESERCGRRQKEKSAWKCMKTRMSCMRGVCWRRARTSNGKKVISKKSKVKLKKTSTLARLLGKSAAGHHVMQAEMFQRVKDLGEKTIGV